MKIRVTINLNEADGKFDEWVQHMLDGDGVGHVTQEGVTFWYYKSPTTLIEFKDIEVLEK